MISVSGRNVLALTIFAALASLRELERSPKVTRPHFKLPAFEKDYALDFKAEKRNNSNEEALLATS